ncbi:MAG: DinB family protein [Vicinamibacteria bacterium]|nr:DinB family protein [Vicinamibacteria bacterium]
MREVSAPQIDLLAGFLDEAFEVKAWHGPNLRGAIRGLTARAAAWRPAPGRHNIWEIVVHAAYWKYAVWRRITGTKRGSFPYKGSNWFERPLPRARNIEAEWRADVAMLVIFHRRLMDEVLRLRDADLPRRTRGSRQTNLTVMRGIAAHDLYHAGQIQLIKRLLK